MTDIAQGLRIISRLLAGCSKEERPLLQTLLLKWIEDNPTLKINLPTPGTEPKLNGLAVADLAAVVDGLEPGDYAIADLVEAVGGNRKSARDRTKVMKLIPALPLLQYTKATRSSLIRLAGRIE